MSKRFCNLQIFSLTAIFCVLGSEFAYCSIQKTKADGKVELRQEQNLEQSAAAKDLKNAESPKAFRQVLSDLAWGRYRKNSGVMDQNKSSKNAPSSIQTPAHTTLVPQEEALKQQQIARQMVESRMAYCGQNWQRDPSCGVPAPGQKAK